MTCFLEHKRLKLVFLKNKKSNNLNRKSLQFLSRVDLSGLATRSSKPLERTSLATDQHVRVGWNIFFHLPVNVIDTDVVTSAKTFSLAKALFICEAILYLFEIKFFKCHSVNRVLWISNETFCGARRFRVWNSTGRLATSQRGVCANSTFSQLVHEFHGWWLHRYNI